MVKENTFYFEINESIPEGEGFDILRKEIEHVQFVVLGEEHFSARVSEFTNSIIPTLAKNNFKYFAAEIGPNSAAEISRQITKNGSLYDFNTEVYSLVDEVPVPFFDGVEDEVFLKSFMENGFEIWGIDQEYLTSQVFLMDRLYQLSDSSKEVESLYLKANDFAISETKKARQDRKYRVYKTLLNAPEINNYFDKLGKSDKQISKIISDLKESWEVYKLRKDNEFRESIYKRLSIMQENFIRYYKVALQNDTLPKVFLKIGGVHASKGKSHDKVYDIGNFMMELANYNSRKSVHILIFPSGYINKDGTISKNIEKEDEQLFDPIIDVEGNKWTVIDLKSIEKSSWKQKVGSKSLKDYMYRFDYMILTPPSKQTELNYKK
ncbi:hypothetical protein ACOKFD_14010 [Flagellimonas sp. S174]|uniref:hypothetical protein n=1 Tax=Flagellimonas sp. S174 TaxID=3410790 RepID=UPI003BF4B50D